MLLPLPPALPFSSVFMVVGVVRSASLRFFFGGLGFAPKEEKPIVEAMSASSGGGEGEAEGMVGEGSDMLVVGCLFLGRVLNWWGRGGGGGAERGGWWYGMRRFRVVVVDCGGVVECLAFGTRRFNGMGILGVLVVDAV